MSLLRTHHTHPYTHPPTHTPQPTPHPHPPTHHITTQITSFQHNVCIQLLWVKSPGALEYESDVQVPTGERK